MPYPINIAPADSPILDPIKQRWSPVAFSDTPIETEQIKILFEAARWAPSSFNEQPWRYIYALKTDGEKRMQLESLLVESNAWAKNAFLLGISFASLSFARNNKPNRHAMHDLGCATGYMVLQATQLGLVSHQMAGFDHEKANTVLGVPADYSPGSMFAIGHYGDRSARSEDVRKREEAPRSRKVISEFAFQGEWK